MVSKSEKNKRDIKVFQADIIFKLSNICLENVCVGLIYFRYKYRKVFFYNIFDIASRGTSKKMFRFHFQTLSKTEVE